MCSPAHRAIHYAAPSIAGSSGPLSTARPPPRQPLSRGLQPRRTRNRNPTTSTTRTTLEASHNQQPIAPRTTTPTRPPHRSSAAHHTPQNTVEPKTAVQHHYARKIYI